MTPRIPPKSGNVFTPGQVIRLEFPAQGYVNPLNTTLEFDVTLQTYGTSGHETVRFQNNIQSLFQRVRLLYGATPLEDIINYNVVVRALTEWSSTNQNGTMDQTSIAEGIGGVTVGFSRGATPQAGLVNVRQNFIQGYDATLNTGSDAPFKLSSGIGLVPNLVLATGLTPSGSVYSTRRYQINFALGLFTQDKLIPTKFMASQLAIEITLADSAVPILAFAGTATGASPTYGITQVNLIPEVLEFDAKYDEMFLAGLREGGVPIKFSSWHTYVFNTNSASQLNLQIAERSRSVRALFAVQRRATPVQGYDSGALLSNTAAFDIDGTTLQQYQYRIGSRYFPAAPVQCSLTPGSKVCNGGAEAFLELQKALNCVGDYRLSTSLNTNTWCIGPFDTAISTPATRFSELDYGPAITSWGSGTPQVVMIPVQSATVGNSFQGGLGSAAFCMAIDLQTSNGIEIAGLNAEEQSDISLLVQWSHTQNSAFNIEVYTYYDAMIVLRENNVTNQIDIRLWNLSSKYINITLVSMNGKQLYFLFGLPTVNFQFHYFDDFDQYDEPRVYHKFLKFLLIHHSKMFQLSICVHNKF
jgi:hypothetical protein